MGNLKNVRMQSLPPSHAHRTHGYTLNEIVRKLGLHFATVGRIARLGEKS